VAQELGLLTDRGLAVLFDRISQMGREPGIAWVRAALAGAPVGADATARIGTLVAAARTQQRPWATRLAALKDDSRDLYDTIFRPGAR